MPNVLAGETSPYLLQHADNPVHWYPWGEAALSRARLENKPIFLSIGYSACHWCHVMAHESFEDDATAAIMNSSFVNTKVDREERPDLDQIYMGAVQAMTGSGGWPMSVFLTPDGVPFYGGTYFPPAPRHGLPSFRDVLRAVADAWHTQREELERAGKRLVERITRQGGEPGGTAGELTREVLETAFANIKRQFDSVHGGWGSAPKFPQPMVIEFLLRYHHLTGDAASLEMVTRTLEAMARGGIYDQLGGGFHRYSVDERWLVPHFEKMLYDNAQLARVYLHAWQVTGNDFFRTITEEILDYVNREMLDPAGGFYSTQDADSEGEEGKFFVWTPDEIRHVLGSQASPLQAQRGRGDGTVGVETFMATYAVTPDGNFEGKNILEFVGDVGQRSSLAEARRRLFQARERRVHPGRDDKVLTAWNGLMLAAFAEAARVLDREDYRQAAERNADFLLRELREENGRLHRTWKARPEHAEGAGEAKLNGYLEDYAYLIEGLQELYQTTFEPRWFVAAHELAETMLRHFADSEGLLYDTSDDHEALIARPRSLQDNATPSGSAMAVTTLLKLAGFTNELRYVDICHNALAQMQPLMSQYPLGFGQWLQALFYALSRPQEIAIVGDLQGADAQALLNVVRKGYRPLQIVALGAPNPDTAIPLLRNRGLVEGRATAYLCDSPVPGLAFACQAPVTEPERLQIVLGSRDSSSR